MKTVIKLSFYSALFVISPSYAQPVVTEVIRGGTLTHLPMINHNVNIPQSLGTTTFDNNGTPVNLFHSFDTFNIGNGDSVTFKGVDFLKNVFARVTGGEVSNIYGTLKSEIKNANFYFINPSGVTFGATAQVDVPAAFHVSTADSVKFANYEFKATNPNSVSSRLIIAEPTSFGFIGHLSAATVTLNGNGVTVTDSGTVPNSPLTSFSMKEGKTLDIVANNIRVQNAAQVSAPSGQIRLVAFKGAGDVSLENKYNYLTLPKLEPSSVNSGSISITDHSRVKSDGTGSGKTFLWGGDIDIKNTSGVSANTNGTGTGAVTVISNRLNLVNGSLISTDTTTDYNAGNINVKSNLLNIDGLNIGLKGVTGISSSANPRYENIRYDPETQKVDFDLIETKGNAGTITVNSKTLNIKSGGQIRSDTYNLGNAGRVSVTTNTLRIEGVDIEEKEKKNWSPTGISSVTRDPFFMKSGHEGNAGVVEVTAKESLILTNTAEISSSSQSEGNAGEVTVTAGKLLLDGNTTNISSAATSDKTRDYVSTGYTGNVTVTANQSIQLHNGSEISIKSDAKVPSGSEIGKSVLTVSAPDIELTDSEITSESTGTDNAGDIVVNFSHGLRMNSASISTIATGEIGNGGDITLNGSDLIYLQNSSFLTSVSGATSNGGNINVTADALVMETGGIQANAVGGSGGDINIFLRALIPSQNNLILGGSKVDWHAYQSGLNVIQAASETGVSGSVNVNSPQFDISGSVSGLDTSDLVLPSIAQNPCQSASTRSSSLTRGSKGGIPVNEAKTVFIPTNDMSTNTKTGSEKNTSNARSSSLEPIDLQQHYPCATMRPL
jgi:filamentous hemagglutinin family protein